MNRSLLFSAFRTAMRDARGSRTQALLHAFGMALGIAAMVAMGSFSSDLDLAVEQQTRSLIGADITVTSRGPFSDQALAVLGDFPGQSAEMIRFSSMAMFPKSGNATLCRIRGVEPGFPFYGELETVPPDAAQTFFKGKGALVERNLLDRVGASVGDVIRLGRVDFTITGVLERAPGEPPATAVMGPRIYIPYQDVAETELIQMGSRVFYSQLFKTPVNTNPEDVLAPHLKSFKEQRLSWETVESYKENLGEAMGNLGRFLGLTACLALLLGALGLAGAVHYHLARKVRQIAVMRCLGATLKQVMSVYLIQITLMALLGGAIGTVLGVGLQFFLPRLVADLLPFEFEPRIHGSAIVTALGWGLCLCLLLAIPPLARVRQVSPLMSFRPGVTPARRDGVQYVAYSLALGGWWIFAAITTGSMKQGSYFIAFLIGAIGLLFLTAKGTGRLARVLLSPRLPFTFRHGLSNLFRPHNQTVVFLIILGMGIFLVTIIVSVRTMLIGQFDQALSNSKPNFLAFDIQQDQTDGVLELFQNQKIETGEPIPIVVMRLESMKGAPVSQWLDDEDIPEWTLRREYRSTYRTEMTDTETLVEGEWIKEIPADSSVIPISLGKDIAASLKLKLGDPLVMDVMGMPVECVVASIREIKWQSMQPNFYMVFPAGILESAPQMMLLAAKTEDGQQSAGIQNELAKKFPNVSSVDLTDLAASIEGLMAKAGAVIRFLAALCMLTGLVLLGSAIWNSRYQRLGENALLRTLGATGRQVALIGMVEYFLLGLFASITGLALAIAAAWGLGVFLFDVSPFPKPLALLPPILILPLMTLGLGFFSMRSIWTASPRILLRQED